MFHVSSFIHCTAELLCIFFLVLCYLRSHLSFSPKPFSFSHICSSRFRIPYLVEFSSCQWRLPFSLCCLHPIQECSCTMPAVFSSESSSFAVAILPGNIGECLPNSTLTKNIWTPPVKNIRQVQLFRKCLLNSSCSVNCTHCESSDSLQSEVNL